MYAPNTKLFHIVLDAKYEKADLHKVMETQCQLLTTTQRHDLLILLQKYKEFFDGTLGTWKIYPLDFKLKEYAKPIFSRTYPVPKVHEEIIKKGVECLVLLGIL